jgi:L-ascorbate metabolism protein UlaG (beta-lactamase superfamily)
VRLTLIRNATVLLELAGKRVLVDPMLDDAGARPPIEGTRNPVANPTTPLPISAQEVVSGLDAVLVTHRHRDHLDGTAEELLPRDVPVFCQPEDEEALRELGLDARTVSDELEWDGLRIARTPARHGSGPIADALAPVSGFVLDGGLYIAGDTVWYEGVEETIDRYRPRIAVVNAGGAEFAEGGLIIMGRDDVREVAERVPTVVAVHLEALNHCYLTRAVLRATLPGVLVPDDGETLELG